MSQDPPFRRGRAISDDLGLRRLRRPGAHVIDAALLPPRQPKEGPPEDPFSDAGTRERLRDYGAFLDQVEQTDMEWDPAGPGDLIVAIGRRVSRLAVRHRLIIQAGQYDRVVDWLGARGASVVGREDDSWELGVALLDVAGIEPQALYEAIRHESAEPAAGAEPLAMSLDDVTYENVVLKPVRPKAAGTARLTDAGLGDRPTGTGLGAGITVGVIDGGFADPAAPSRTDGWADNVVTVTDGHQSLSQANPGALDPGAGHGTFVTGVVLQHAPDAAVRQYRAVDSHGFGSSWRLMNCLMSAAADGCQVINCSLGFEDPDLIGNPAISAALHHLALKTDTLVVAAAGNSGTTTPMLPASHKGAIGVGGTEEDLDPLAWSNRGPWVDCSTVADPVVSIFVFDPQDPTGEVNPWASWYGTSFAAPAVAGELAVRLGQGLDPETALDDLYGGSTRIPSPDYGYLLALR